MDAQEMTLKMDALLGAQLERSQMANIWQDFGEIAKIIALQAVNIVFKTNIKASDYILLGFYNICSKKP